MQKVKCLLAIPLVMYGWFQVKVRVRQGCVLSPDLFLFFKHILGTNNERGSRKL